jgi:flavin reductase (DIM6/NTAB) family NADH-FMN oxidoreductase RutF
MLRLPAAVGIDPPEPHLTLIPACPWSAGRDEPIDSQLFRDIFAGFPSGVTVVTAVDGNGVPVGLTVSAVMSLSLTPPQLVISLDSRKYTARAIKESRAFTINFLADDQHALADRFARPAPDKFAGLDWESGRVLGAPVLTGTRAHAECRLERQIRSGDHLLLIGEVVAGESAPASGLAYCDRSYGTVGAAPAGEARVGRLVA